MAATEVTEHAPETVPVGRKPKLKYSNFMVTINTNKCMHTQEDYAQYAPMLRVLVRRMVTDEGMARVIKFIGAPAATHSWSPEWIHRSRADFTIEVGGQKRCLHTHLILRIEHVSRIQVNRAGVKSFFAQHPDFHANPHIDIKLLKGHENVLDYLNKPDPALPSAAGEAGPAPAAPAP